MRITYFICLFYIAAFTAIGQKQTSFSNTVTERSSAQLLATKDGGYYVAVHQDEYFSGLTWNVVIYLTYFDNCDQEIWTRKLITPFDGAQIRALEYSSDASLLISLVELDGTLDILELDLNGEVLHTKKLEYQIINCDRIHHNYIEVNNDRDFYVTGYTSCAGFPRRAFFLYIENMGESMIGKAFFHSSHDTHIKFLPQDKILGQVGAYYFQMTDFENILDIKKISYKEEDELYLANQPLIDSSFAYLTIERTSSEIFIVKVDLTNFEAIWQSPIIDINLPIRTNLGINNNIIVTTRGAVGPNIFIVDHQTGAITKSASLTSSNNFSYSEVKYLNANNICYLNSTSPSNTTNETELFLELNPLLGLCDNKAPIASISHNEIVKISSLDTSLFTTDIDFVFNDFGIVENSLLDTLFYRQNCSELVEELIYIDTTLSCNETFFLENFLNQDFDYKWYDGIEEPNRVFDQSGNYECIISNCRHQYRLMINLTLNNCTQNIYIPNVISHWDEKDQLFSVETSQPLTSLDLKIYNRWGNLIHRSTDQNQSWNPDRSILSGVYIYKVIYKFNEEEEEQIQTGTITVLD